MINCKEASELIERGRFERLGWGKRVGLRFHTSICKNCRKYFKDSELMEQMMHSKRFRHMSSYSFTAEEKEKLKKLLNSNLPD